MATETFQIDNTIFGLLASDAAPAWPFGNFQFLRDDDDLSVVQESRAGSGIDVVSIGRWTFESPSGEGTVIKLTIHSRLGVDYHAVGYPLLTVGVYLNGTYSWGTPHQNQNGGPDGDLIDYTDDFTTKPGGGAWTWADLADAELALRADWNGSTSDVRFGGLVLRCAKAWGVVHFTPDSDVISQKDFSVGRSVDLDFFIQPED